MKKIIKFALMFVFVFFIIAVIGLIGMFIGLNNVASINQWVNDNQIIMYLIRGAVYLGVYLSIPGIVTKQLKKMDDNTDASSDLNSLIHQFRLSGFGMMVGLEVILIIRVLT